MNPELQQYLKSIGVGETKIASIETNHGITDEAGLKAFVETHTSVASLKKALKITPKSASALLEKYPAPAPVLVGSDRYQTVVGAFAGKLGISLADATKGLDGVLGDTSDDAVSWFLDPEVTELSDVVTAFSSLPAPKVRGALKDIREQFGTSAAPAPAPSAPSPSGPAHAGTGSAMAQMGAMVLPEVPGGVSLLQRLAIGGVLKIDENMLIAAVRVLFTDAAGFFDIEERLRRAIEERSVRAGRPVPPIYMKLDRMVSKSDPTVAEALNILSVELGIDRRRYASKTKKAELLKALAGVFDVFSGVQQQCEAYQEQWMQGGMNPNMMMQAMMSIAGGVASPAAQMAMAPPETTSVVASVHGAVEHINRMFAGTRALTAAALQPDILGVASILDNDELISAVGAQDREEMLVELGLGATADMVQLEMSVLKFMLAVLQIPNKDMQSQPMYISSIAMLGKQIPWDRLSAMAGGSGSNGSDRRPGGFGTTRDGSPRRSTGRGVT